MIDSNDMAQEYVKAYTDKSRIYFIEKYLSTFDGTEGKNVITNPQKNNIDISSCSIIIKYNNGSISVENDSSIVNDTCPTF